MLPKLSAQGRSKLSYRYCWVLFMAPLGLVALSSSLLVLVFVSGCLFKSVRLVCLGWLLWMTPSISYSSRVKYPLEQTALPIRWPCLSSALTETLHSRSLSLWPYQSLPQIDLSCTTEGMHVVHWSGQYCYCFSLMNPKLVFSREARRLCGDLRVCYCQSCQRDKRIWESQVRFHQWG